MGTPRRARRTAGVTTKSGRSSNTPARPCCATSGRTRRCTHSWRRRIRATRRAPRCRAQRSPALTTASLPALRTQRTSEGPYSCACHLPARLCCTRAPLEVAPPESARGLLACGAGRIATCAWLCVPTMSRRPESRHPRMFSSDVRRAVARTLSYRRPHLFTSRHTADVLRALRSAKERRDQGLRENLRAVVQQLDPRQCRQSGSDRASRDRRRGGGEPSRKSDLRVPHVRGTCAARDRIDRSCDRGRNG